MAPAAEAMAAALAETEIKAPGAPIVSNVTAGPIADPDEIRARLVEQVTARVRWRESILWMAHDGGVSRFCELGAGRVLTGMAKRIAPETEAVALNTPTDLEAFAQTL
jgi:[acyl-carrier-protein] S-malonyltransferase